MERSQEDRDRLYAAYEGLAEKAAGSVWAQWAGTLSPRGVGLDDLQQQAKCDLLELVAKAEDVGGGFPTYVWKTLTGYLKKRFISNEITRTSTKFSQEIKNFPRFIAETPPKTVYYSGRHAPLVEKFCGRMLAGDSADEAQRAVGWSRGDLDKAMGFIRRRLKQEEQGD